MKKLTLSIVNAWPNRQVSRATEREHLIAAGAAPADHLVDDKVLKAALGSTDSFPREIGGVKLTPSEAAILEILLKRNEVHRAGLMIATHDGPGDDKRDGKLVDVWICHLRKKMERLGIGIEHGDYTAAVSLTEALSNKARFKTFVQWIVGETPLIVHAWSEKARREMLQKHVKATRGGKELRDPQAEFVHVMQGDRKSVLFDLFRKGICQPRAMDVQRARLDVEYRLAAAGCAEPA